MIFDTHAHYDDEQFDTDRDALLRGMAEQNVGTIINVGASLEGCWRSVELANQYPFVYAAVGVHPDETGEFNEKTYRSMVELCAWLCLKFNLDEESVIRHYDVTGKNCPKYFVEHEEAWTQFKSDVGRKLKEYQ